MYIHHTFTTKYQVAWDQGVAVFTYIANLFMKLDDRSTVPNSYKEKDEPRLIKSNNNRSDGFYFYSTFDIYMYSCLISI